MSRYPPPVKGRAIQNDRCTVLGFGDPIGDPKINLKLILGSPKLRFSDHLLKIEMELTKVMHHAKENIDIAVSTTCWERKRT